MQYRRKSDSAHIRCAAWAYRDHRMRGSGGTASHPVFLRIFSGGGVIDTDAHEPHSLHLCE